MKVGNHGARGYREQRSDVGACLVCLQNSTVSVVGAKRATQRRIDGDARGAAQGYTQ